MITETDEIPLILRKQDEEVTDEGYDPEDDEEEIKSIFKDYLAAIGAAIIAAQQAGLLASAQEGARAAGGGLTASEIEEAVQAAADFNAEHFSGLKDDAVEALNKLIQGKNYNSVDDFQESLSSLMDQIAARAERYGKGGGNAAWSRALRMAGEANNLPGGVWDCNFGSGSCDDCQGLHGEFLTWDEFDITYQHTACDGGCNCGFHAAANPESLLDDIGPDPEGDPLPPAEEAA